MEGRKNTSGFWHKQVSDGGESSGAPRRMNCPDRKSMIEAEMGVGSPRSLGNIAFEQYEQHERWRLCYER
jgi:hypothetical protein